MKFQVINIKTNKAVCTPLSWHEADNLCKKLNLGGIKYKIVEVKN